MADTPTVDRINESTSDFFWEDGLEPIPNVEAYRLIDDNDTLDKALDQGTILDRDGALALAEAIDAEGPFGPDYARG